MIEITRSAIPTLVAASCLVVVLSACESSGGIGGATRSCSTSGGFLDDTTVTCSGRIDTLTGNIGVEFGNDDDFEDSTYDQRLQATFTTGSGTAMLTAPGPDGGTVELGMLEAGETLRVDETVSFTDDDNSINFDADENGELGNIEYEATATSLR